MARRPAQPLVLKSINARGTISDTTTYQMRKGRQIIFPYNVPTGPPTRPQIEQRTIFQKLALQFASISPDGRTPEAWEFLGSNTPPWSSPYDTFHNTIYPQFALDHPVTAVCEFKLAPYGKYIFIPTQVLGPDPSTFPDVWIKMSSTTPEEAYFTHPASITYDSWDWCYQLPFPPFIYPSLPFFVFATLRTGTNPVYDNTLISGLYLFTTV